MQLARCPECGNRPEIREHRLGDEYFGRFVAWHATCPVCWAEGPTTGYIDGDLWPDAPTEYIQHAGVLWNAWVERQTVSEPMPIFTGVCVAGAVALLALGLLLASPAQSAAHEWYDPDCCSDADCAPVTWLGRDADGRIWVETSHGKARLTTAASVRVSHDGMRHACIHNGRLLCLYLPPGA